MLDSPGMRLARNPSVRELELKKMGKSYVYSYYIRFRVTSFFRWRMSSWLWEQRKYMAIH
jgi:hypothetical protein